MTINADVDNSIINLGELPHECFATGYDHNLYGKKDFRKTEFKITNTVVTYDKNQQIFLNITLIPVTDAPTPQQ